MFYDERIESVKGKISKKAILISLVMSLALGALHVCNIVKNSGNLIYLLRASLEISVFLGAFIVYIIGFFTNLQAKDEQTQLKQDMFYNKAANFLIKYISVVFAIALPIILFLGKSYNFADDYFYRYFLTTIFVVAIYVIYEFKRNDVYFNYSIIDCEDYLKRVFKNIGKALLWLIILLAVSFLSVVGIIIIAKTEYNVIGSVLLSVAAHYFYITFAFGLFYLFFSLLEKNSYKSEGFISQSTIVLLVVTILFFIIYTSVVVFINSAFTANSVIMQIFYSLSFFDGFITAAFLTFSVYFGYEYQKNLKNKLLNIAIFIIVLSRIFSVIAESLFDGITFYFLSEIQDDKGLAIQRIISTVKVFVNNLSLLILAIGLLLVIFALIKDGVISKLNWLICLFFVVAVCVDLFLRTQTFVIDIKIYRLIVETCALFYYVVIVAFVGKKLKMRAKNTV